MPIDFHIDKTHQMVRISLEGVVNVNTFLETLESVLSHPDFYPRMSTLIDLTQATHGATVDDITKIAEYVIANRERLEGGKVAIVVSRTVTYGLMRMFQAHVDTLRVGLNVFYDMDKARRWLGGLLV
jgi:hypothetical protein